jgi:phospholipase A1/A2
MRHGELVMRHIVAIFLIATHASVTWAGEANGAENSLENISDTSTGLACAQLDTDPSARLACFDRWAALQIQRQTQLRSPPKLAAPSPPAAQLTVDCHNGPQTELSRFWELEAGSDCGRFNLRSYQPISLSLIASDSVNTAPYSPTPGHASASQPYLTSEGRIQLSVRVKIAQGIFNGFNTNASARDSLWFAYSQQSNWQFFTSSLSRPFRSTDHEPELMYIAPAEAQLPGGWRLRYSGISLNHQSNGQSLPLSRSWNRIILLAGMEKDTRFHVKARYWYRIPETAIEDDNPEISDTVGRAEVAGAWKLDKDNSLGLTVRHSLRGQANGSYRLEWLKTLGDSGQSGRDSGLRFHLQLFSGYGDSLVDYNRQRTVLSVGLSLADW